MRERLARWQLILGQGATEGGENSAESPSPSSHDEQKNRGSTQQHLEQLLQSLYGGDGEGGDEDARPDIARWVGDLHHYFPDDVAQLMQRDMIKRLKLKTLLNDPLWLEQVEPDLILATQILALRRSLSAETLTSAKQVVQKVVDQLIKELKQPLLAAINGALHRATPNNRPKLHEINWHRTIRTNLKHYQPSEKALIPERLIGYGKKRPGLRELFICVDQSGSMAQSSVYAAIFASVISQLPALTTHLITFSTAVVDHTDHLDDPVAILFAGQLHGGTYIHRALAYCAPQITRPADTIFLLITDLYEGGDKTNMVAQLADLQGRGVQLIVLLALSDEGKPRYDEKSAEQLQARGIPTLACTPRQFPLLMGQLLAKQ